MYLSSLRSIFFVVTLLGVASALAQPFGGYLVKSSEGAGHSYVEIPASPAFDFSTGFTFEAWVAGPNINACSSLAGKNYTTAWWVGICGTTLRSYLKGSNSYQDGGTVPAGCTHVAVTYDGATRNHYIGGELVFTNAETGPMQTSSDPVRINSDVPWTYSYASIDEVRFWNVARTQNEIQATMNTVLNAPQAGLVAVYHLDGSANDALGGHDGTTHGLYSVQIPEVVEFYNTPLDNYFITASAVEAAAIDGGSAGPGWSRTGNVFLSGGSTSVCRFYGSITPGPNSHFYTASATECADLQALQAATPPTQKRWNFESLDFQTTATVAGGCPAGTRAVLRAYNDGFGRGVDSNHRITTNPAAIQEVVSRGWISEGVVMCAPI